MAKCSGSAKKARAYVQRYKESEKHCTDANAYCTKRSFSKLSVGAYINHQNKRARLPFGSLALLRLFYCVGSVSLLRRRALCIWRLLRRIPRWERPWQICLCQMSM